MKYSEVTSAYRKALKVIDSCENEYHLQGANNYINNFLAHFSKKLDYKTRSGETMYESDQFVSTAYVRLRDKYRIKKHII